MENNGMKRIQDVIDDFVKWLKEQSENFGEKEEVGKNND